MPFLLFVVHVDYFYVEEGIQFSLVGTRIERLVRMLFFNPVVLPGLAVFSMLPNFAWSSSLVIMRHL